MQQTKISGVFDRHCRWFPASSCLKADRPHAAFTLYPPGGNARRPLLSSILARARRNGLQYLSLGALRPRYTQGHTCVTINFSIRGELDEALRVGRVRDLQRY